MAYLHPQDSGLVVRVVYDGPPEAGKTSSVTWLAKSFGRPVETPAEENGRTVFFDWLEHRAGVYEGSPVRLQIVSVPGQKRWARRRKHFVDGADVVVYVGDTSRPRWAETVARWRALEQEAAAQGEAAMRLVFQANKRDRPDAVPIDEVRAEVGSEAALVEASAADGTGVQQAFVTAVRLALERTRRLGPVERSPLLEARAERLVETLRDMDDDPGKGPLTVRPPPLATGDPATRDPLANLPDGFIWPPATGRALLDEVRVGRLDLASATEGARTLGLGSEWRIHSAASAVFANVEDARDSLVAWARVHARAKEFLSARRCIVLLETTDHTWRLWQLIYREPSLRDAFLDDLEGNAKFSAVAGVERSLRALVRAREECRDGAYNLSCNLDTVGFQERGVQHVGPTEHRPNAPLAEPTLAQQAWDLATLVRDRAWYEPNVLIRARAGLERAPPKLALEVEPLRDLLARAWDAA